MADQVIVHVVRRGGASTIKRICSQMEYLTRKGKLRLQFSERHGAGFIPYNELPDWARRWGEQAGNYVDGSQVGNAEQHMTTHIVFSLPPGTDNDAAYRAMRKAAEDVFGATIIRENNRGNPHEFDYLTVFHTDKPHPHLHVLVNRKSLQRDPDTKKHEWLKIARRNTRVNYALMRERFAYWAQQEGIDVEATSRVERGIHTRSLTNEQFRINARQAVAVCEHYGNSMLIAVDSLSPSRSQTPEVVAGPSTQRPPGSGSASGQTGDGTGGGGTSRPDISTNGNGTHYQQPDDTHPAPGGAAETERIAMNSRSSAGEGTEPANDPEQGETDLGSSGAGSEQRNNVIDAQRSRNAERQRRERTQRRRANRELEDAEDDRTRRRTPQNASSSGTGSGSGPGSTIDEKRSNEINRQQEDRIARDHAAREAEDAEGDRRRRRIPQNSSLSPEREDGRSIGTAPENTSAGRADTSPPPASSDGRSDAPHHQPIDNEQFQFTFNGPQDGGGGGAPANAADLTDETAAQATARLATARARRRGDDLDRIVRTRGQKTADELRRIEDGPVSGRLRSSTRPRPDRTR